MSDTGVAPSARPQWHGWFYKGFRSRTPVGVAGALAIFVALLVLDGLLLEPTAIAVNKWLLHGDLANRHDLTKAGIASLLPVGVVVAILALLLARARGGTPRDVLSLRGPGVGVGGSLAIVVGFVAFLYVLLVIFMALTGLDPSQYVPGHGNTDESVGQVKEAMFDLAADPRLFLLAVPSVAIGAPLAEELIFRGQIFTALANSRLGFVGATVLTSAAWALMHFTEPWLAIGQIFVMGLVLGYLLYRFGSLWLTMLCHGTWNLIVSLMIFGSGGS